MTTTTVTSWTKGNEHVEITKDLNWKDYTVTKKQFDGKNWWTVATQKFDSFLQAEIYANSGRH